MIDILFLLICNSFMIVGLYRSSNFEWSNDFQFRYSKVRHIKTSDIDKKYNMILWWFRFYSYKYLGMKWSKPVATCPTCMASVHSSYIYWTIGVYLLKKDFNINVIQCAFIYVPYVLALAGMNALLTNKTE